MLLPFEQLQQHSESLSLPAAATPVSAATPPRYRCKKFCTKPSLQQLMQERLHDGLTSRALAPWQQP